MIDKYASRTLVRIVGQFLVNNADKLIMVEYSDLTGDDIKIHLVRRKDMEEKENDDSNMDHSSM